MKRPKSPTFAKKSSNKYTLMTKNIKELETIVIILVNTEMQNIRYVV